MTKKGLTVISIVGAAVFISWIVFAVEANSAWPNYSQGCDNCHGDFNTVTSPTENWSLDKHTVHYNMVGFDCAVCHDGTPTSSSENMTKCASCHGHDYTGFTTDPDLDRDAAVGLRVHHEPFVGNTCINCHSGAPAPADPTSMPEDTPTSFGIDPCDGSEDWEGTQGTGLDNDGDGLYEMADPDCGGAVEDCFDGMDNDGDGAIDCADADCDGAVGAPTTCGVGVCEGNTGELICDAGQEVDSCDPFAGAGPDDATCDGLDNDCDGAVDEDYAVTPTTCGVGVCEGNTGELICDAGQEVDSCDPFAGAGPDDATCDGLDNDCDGAVDEDYSVTPTTCGVGVCEDNTGELICDAGQEVDSCDPFAGAGPDDATCDGLDNDCDGAVDEDYAVTPTTCGVGVCEGNTGELICDAGQEVDSCDPFAGAGPDDATCDGLDNDCDGAVDEDYSVTPTTCGVGVCEDNTGELICDAGQEVDSCDPFAGAGPDDATCDGLDNDCDGAVDEDYAATSTTCGVGVCEGNTGELICDAGQEVDSCDPFAGAGPDDATCDGLDNDCDGAVDEDYSVTPTTCGVGVCEDNTGELICDAGQEVDSCDPFAGAGPDDATCDGLDNDCDGAVDEDYAATSTTCGVGVCEGNTGELICDAGQEVDTCDPFAGAAPEVCEDGLDNDCDGAADIDDPDCQAAEDCFDGADNDGDGDIDCADADCDGAIGAPTSCGIGECASSGNLVCQGGIEVDTCEEGTPAPDDSVCDGRDNDCDGAVDEDYVTSPTSCGTGECASTGELVCQGGVEVDTCEEGTPAADDSVCDGLDNDCDGAVDEDYSVTPTTCGVGVCEGNTGELICDAGQEVDSCDPFAGAGPDDATCDGLDNDCDGAVDEDYAVTPTTCGVGVCEGNTGELICDAGQEVDSCDPFAGAAPEVCEDGLDNDCDGAADIDDPDCQAAEDCFDGADNDGDGDIDCADADCDGAIGAPTSCGIGECASSGNLVCQGGIEVDTCEEGTPAADDSVCDGLDNDCDGEVDEDYVTSPTSCGTGECASSGNLVCQGGVEVNTCEEGTPAADDAVCDGLDNDCDGAVDEDYVTSPTSCGTGECASTGNLVCQGGVEVDTCEEGTPAPDDSVCDGRDNDCDGAVDEDFVPEPTSCGIGECAATGMTECVGGDVGDTCEPGAPVAEICDDGFDNDCDGLIDIDDPDCAPPGCQSDADCDDGLFCTVDSCDVATGQCSALSACPPAILGCVEVNAFCDEDNDQCVDVPNDALCDNDLFCDGTETCDADSGECLPGTPVVCDDDLYCNGVAVCNEDLDECTAGAPVDCSDAVSCTVDSCNETTDSCDNLPDDALCDNGLFCDGAETCDPVSDCQAGVPPCDPDIQSCNEEIDICEDTGDGKVVICHKGKKTLKIDRDSLNDHLGHGDTLGPCPGDDEDSDSADSDSDTDGDSDSSEGSDDDSDEKRKKGRRRR